MKVGFLGNTNNYPFIIASQMRELGCEVILYIDAPREEMLNRPEYYSKDITYPYPDWIIEKPSLRKSLHIHFPLFFERDVLRKLNDCDAVILNDYGHRFKNSLRSSIVSISMFSGVDLEVMADYENVAKMKKDNAKLRWFPLWLRKKFAKFSVNQLRRGIAKAGLVSYFPKGLSPGGDKILDEIFEGKEYARFDHIHVITKDHPYNPPVVNKHFTIFSLTRFMWKEPFPPARSSMENKGNDIMIKGIALFLKTYSKLLDIHFIEKGLHVAETKELIQQYGFSHMVTWHKEMPFRELESFLIKSDVVFEQLGTHFISGGFYAMLRGRPVIGNARPEVFDLITGERTPVCHAVTPEDVCLWLQRLTNDQELAKQIGIKSRQYVLDHFDILDETKYFKDFIEEKVKNRRD